MNSSWLPYLADCEGAAPAWLLPPWAVLLLVLAAVFSPVVLVYKIGRARELRAYRRLRRYDMHDGDEGGVSATVKKMYSLKGLAQGLGRHAPRADEPNARLLVALVGHQAGDFPLLPT